MDIESKVTKQESDLCFKMSINVGSVGVYLTSMEKPLQECIRILRVRLEEEGGVHETIDIMINLFSSAIDVIKNHRLVMKKYDDQNAANPTFVSGPTTVQ